MPRILTLLLGLALVVLCGTGCNQVRFRRGEPLAKYAHAFTPHCTDFERVMSVLGPPPKLSRTANGFAFLYEHVQTLENQIGISAEKILKGLGIEPGSATHHAVGTLQKSPASLGEGIAGAVRLLYAWEKAEVETLALEFDHAGTLQTAVYLHEKLDLGSTIGVSLVVSASPKVGDADYKVPSSELYWGLSLLEWMPWALNRGQKLNNGMNGVARSPAGFFVGQDITVPRASAARRQKRKANRR